LHESNRGHRRGLCGLTTGACFAHLGHDVVCADVVPEKIERLNRGEIPIVEAGSRTWSPMDCARVACDFVLGAVTAVADAEFVYLWCPRPRASTARPTCTYLEAAAAEIRDHLEEGAVVVNKSTVPVGSTKVVERVLRRPDVAVVSNPEFLREGTAVHDFLHPDRIVVGSDDQGAAIRWRPSTSGVRLRSSSPTRDCRAHQVRRQRLPRDQALLHQRRRALSEHVGADVADVVVGIGLRQAHRAGVPEARTGLGRELLPEGHQGARAHRRGRRVRLQPPAGLSST
jgi:UDPglucose 6-dehydrogenase